MGSFMTYIILSIEVFIFIFTYVVFLEDIFY